MMRPKSAMFYIHALNDIAEEVSAKIEQVKDDRDTVDDVTNLMNEYSLEVLGHIFIGTKFGALQGSAYGAEVIKKVKSMFKLFFLLMPLPRQVAEVLPMWKMFLRLHEHLFKIGELHINAAIEKDRRDGSLEGPVSLTLRQNFV